MIPEFIAYREEISYVINDKDLGYHHIKTVVSKRRGSKGWFKTSGYISRPVNDHPRSDKKGYMYEHRLVMERHIGRFLKAEERIHHKNKDRTNNNIFNLELLCNNSMHRKKDCHKLGRNENGQFVADEPIFNEIKHRLYDKDNDVTCIYTLSKLISTTFRIGKFEHRGSFAGFKDKNGIEIYSGDIVKIMDQMDEMPELDSNTGIGCVEWLGQHGFWNISKIENSLGDILQEYNVEIIGNIYENSKLPVNQKVIGHIAEEE